MATPTIVHAYVPIAGLQGPTPQAPTTVVAGGRLVVFQGEDGEPERGEMFDPIANQWTPIASAGAPRYGSFKDGPGPLSHTSYFAFEDWVVIVWFDGNHNKLSSVAVFDVRHNSWRMATTKGLHAELGEAYEAGTEGRYVRLQRRGANQGLSYDIRADRWSVVPTSGRERTSPAIGAAAGKIVVWGGILGEVPGTGMVLDVKTNTWKPMSTAGAPSGREVAWSVVRDGMLATWSGAYPPLGDADLRDGGIYDILGDRWIPIPALNAPEAAENVADVFLDWTGEALVVRALLSKVRSDPRQLTFWDPMVGEWWRSSVSTTWPVLPLAYGRVLDRETRQVLHPREKLACPYTLPSIPIFAHGWPYYISATALIGDELVVWGRIDPPYGSVDEGAILEP
jgi:hypothetical protein